MRAWKDGRGNRNRATPADPATRARLRVELETATPAGLPAPVRAVLLTEAVDLLDASARHQATWQTFGMLTKRGFIRAAVKDYNALQPRLRDVLKLLGLLEPPEPVKPSVEELIARAQGRPWPPEPTPGGSS